MSNEVNKDWFSPKETFAIVIIILFAIVAVVLGIRHFPIKQQISAQAWIDISAKHTCEPVAMLFTKTEAYANVSCDDGNKYFIAVDDFERAELAKFEAQLAVQKRGAK